MQQLRTQTPSWRSARLLSTFITCLCRRTLYHYLVPFKCFLCLASRGLPARPAKTKQHRDIGIGTGRLGTPIPRMSNKQARRPVYEFQDKSLASLARSGDGVPQSAMPMVQSAPCPATPLPKKKILFVSQLGPFGHFTQIKKIKNKKSTTLKIFHIVPCGVKVASSYQGAQQQSPQQPNQHNIAMEKRARRIASTFADQHVFSHGALLL